MSFQRAWRCSTSLMSSLFAVSLLARAPEDSSGTRASSETANEDDVEEVLHRQARWKDIKNAHPQLSGTSFGDSGSRSSALSSARVHEDSSWSQHARGHNFGFRDRPDTFKAAVDAYF